MTAFHDKPFDDATQMKLSIFRGYICEWLPVFMSGPQQVAIYDFFAGPGRDAAGNPGSPVIIADEVKQFCQTRGGQKNARASVRMVFNDADQQNVARLRGAIHDVACGKPCCQMEFSADPFCSSLDRHLPDIGGSGSANLVIMDQFGIKEVTPDVLLRLAACNTTDILFFISSSHIRRFAEAPEMRKYIDADVVQMKNVEYTCIHRFVCRYFRSKLGDIEYHLAPFSIKKGGNIHGVIFGSGHLLGLEKFLNVCWKMDADTGEANYNIDGDIARNGQMSFLPDAEVATKVQVFQRDLTEHIMQHSPDNREVYRFCLVNGFPPPKAGDVLRRIQREGRLRVRDIATGRPARRGAFYLGWKQYKGQPRVRFSIGSDA